MKEINALYRNSNKIGLCSPDAKLVLVFLLEFLNPEVLRFQITK